MEFIPIIYLAYMFIALYMFFLFYAIYLRNKEDMFSYPISKKQYSVSVIVPAYNEQDTLKETINAILKSDYPLKEILIVDDGSKDNTLKIAKELERKNKIVRALTKKNEGKKAFAINFALKQTTSELVAVVDADSYPEPDAIRKMVGFFQEEDVGAVTSSVLVKNKDRFMERLQAFEYAIIAWTRKLLDYVEGVWATPGPLSIYRKKALDKINGFNTNVLTEDIEVTWHILSEGYKTRMCLPARVYSIAPYKFMSWVKQRIRWDIGGIQTVNIYKSTFLRKGMLGTFIMPFFLISMFLGLAGIAIFLYITIKSLISTYLFTEYTFAAGTSLVSIKELNLTPTVLNLFGFILFLLGFLFTYTGLRTIKSESLDSFKIKNIFNILFYLIVYLTCYPIILVIAIYKMIFGKIGWGTK